MQRFINNLSTRAKLMLSFALILALLVAVIVTAYLSLTGVAQSEKTLHDGNFQIALQLEQLRAQMNFQRAQILDMMLSPDKADQQAIEQTLTDRAQQIDALLATLSTLDPDPVFQSKLQSLKNDIAAYRQTRQQEIALIYAGKVDEARLMGNGVGADQFESIRVQSVDTGAKAISSTDQQLAADQEAARSATLFFVIIGVIAALMTIGLVVILNQAIASPLTGIAKVAEQVGGGDLTVDLPEEQRRDEIGALTRAFRQMVETLRRSTADISQAVGLLGSSASEILASTTQVASGTAETATAINETTATVEEVRQAAQLVLSEGAAGV